MQFYKNWGVNAQREYAQWQNLNAIIRTHKLSRSVSLPLMWQQKPVLKRVESMFSVPRILALTVTLACCSEALRCTMSNLMVNFH